MLLTSLQSGSSGNCIYVESQGIRLLFDAGLSATQTESRLARTGRTAMEADALILSHNHSDHVRCAGLYAKKFKMPLFATRKTLAASRPIIPLTREIDVRYFRSGDSIKVGHVTVETIQTPHDAVDGVVFVVDDGKYRLGICTDVGHVFQDLRSLVKSVDGLFLESNYDEKMLEQGRYPRFLKERIHGPGGHISNRDAAELVEKSASSRLQWLCLAHLSDENNTPRKALSIHRQALGPEFPIQVTSRSNATESLLLGENLPLSHHQLSFEEF